MFGDFRGNEIVPDVSLTGSLYNLPAIAAKDDNVAWASAWGVTGSFIGLPSGVYTAVTDTPPAGMRIVITDIIIANAGAGSNLTVQEETTGFPLQFFILPGTQTWAFYPRSKVKTLTPGKRVQIKAGTVGVTVNIGYYYEF